MKVVKISSDVQLRLIDFYIASMIIWHSYQYYFLLKLNIVSDTVNKISWSLWPLTIISIFLICFNKFRISNYLFQILYHSWMSDQYRMINELHYPYFKIALTLLILIQFSRGPTELNWINRTYWLIFGFFYTYFGLIKYIGGVWDKGQSLFITLNSDVLSGLIPAYEKLNPNSIYTLMAVMIMYVQLSALFLIWNKKSKWFIWIILTTMQLGIAFFTQLSHIGFGVLFFHLIALVLHQKSIESNANFTEVGRS